MWNILYEQRLYRVVALWCCRYIDIYMLVILICNYLMRVILICVWLVAIDSHLDLYGGEGVGVLCEIFVGTPHPQEKVI